MLSRLVDVALLDRACRCGPGSGREPVEQELALDLGGHRQSVIAAAPRAAVSHRLDWPPMASVEVQGVEGMQSLVGQEIGPSEWRTVTQDGHRRLRRALRRPPVDPRRRRAGQVREPLRHDDRPRQPHSLPGRRLPRRADRRHRLRPRRQLRLGQDPLPRPGTGRLQGPRPRRGRLRRGEGRRLVPGRHPLHPRGRGQREALLRRRLGHPRDGARRLTGAIELRAYLTVSVPSMPASRWPGTVQK